jgi:ribonuclease T2
MFRLFAIISALLLGAIAASAQVKLEGTFIATQSCPAVQSIKKGSNPGGVTVASGTGYRLLGKNKSDATHYWIEVPNAAPKQRAEGDDQTEATKRWKTVLRYGFELAACFL